jgi:hypothetical protein
LSRGRIRYTIGSTTVSLFPRLGLIATVLAFVACGSSPDPKSAGDEDRAASSKRKKKKKKKRKTAEELEAEERAAAKVRAHQEDRQRVADAKKKSSPFGRTSRDDKEDKEEEQEEEPEAKKPEKKPAKAEKPKAEEKLAKAEKPKPAKAEKPVKAERPIEEEPEEADEITIVDDEDVDPDPVKKKGKAAKAKKPPPPKKVAKKPAREEPEPDADEVAAADTRKGVEKPAKQEPEPEIEEELDEEPAPKAKPKPKQKQVVAAKAKRPEKRKPEPEPEPEPEIEIDEPDEPPRSEAEVLSADTEEDDPLKERRVAAIAVPGVDDGESDEPEEEELPPGAWPMQISDRPLTLAKGKLGVHGGLRYSSLTIRPPGGTPTTTNTTALALGATYGVGEKLEVGLDYALGVSPASAKGPFTLHGAYRAHVGEQLELAIASGVAVDFAQITNAMMQTETVSSYALVLGAWARYQVNKKASLFTGLPATPGVPVTLSKVAFPLPPLPYHATIGLSKDSAIAVDVPFGAGYQIKPNIYAFGALNLAHIRVRNTANAFLFKDIIPLTLGGFYTRKTMDIGVQFSDDLRNGTDNLRLDLLLRYGIK